jgi:hypothetical protein
MAVITTGGSGLWSSVTVNAPWSTGVPPVEGDSVVIALGHTVTVDGTYTAGDDTVTAFAINGTLKASRSVNSSLTVKGQIFTAAATTATIDWGKTGDPIPAGVNATLVLNKSAAMLNHKYGLFVADLSNGTFCGATKTRNTTLVNSVIATATSFDVADGTGWNVGDRVILPETDGNGVHYDNIASITSVTLVSGTRYTVGCAPLAFGHAAGCSAGNFSSNVTVKNFDTTTSTFICFRHTTTASNGRREVSYTSIERVASNASLTTTTCFSAGAAVYADPFTAIAHNSFYECQFSNGTVLNALDSSISVSDNAFWGTSAGSGSGTSLLMASGTTVGADSNVFYTFTFGIGSQVSQGGQGCVITNNKFWSGTNPLALNVGNGWSFSGNQYHLASSSMYITVGAGSFNFLNESYGSSDLPGSPGAFYIAQTVVGTCANFVFTDCRFINPSVSFFLNQSNTSSQSTVRIVNKNQDATLQELWTRYTQFARDNATFKRGRSSLVANTLLSGPGSFTISVPADSGVPVTIVGYLRKNASYGASTLPSVTLSGLGITPQVFTMSNSTDTWEQFTLTATQTAGYSSNLTLTFTAQSSNAAGKAYLDGVASVPFVSWVQHYGYTYDPTNPKRTVDPVVQLTEAAAAALAGISYAAGTLTISGTRSIREVYDWLKQYEAANQLAPIITSVDGLSFTLGANLVLSGALTGSGSLNMAAYTLTAGGSSTIPITHNAGVFTTVSVTGILAGTRVRLYNASTATELYNGVPGTALTLNAAWTTDQTLQLRATLLGRLPYASSGLLTSAGASFQLAQATDAVYVANAVDGSLVTEFSADYPHVYVDVSDPDGVTTVQRLYAWLQYIQTTSTGIQNFFNGITASDAVNYVINTATVNLLLFNLSAAPVKFTGAYLIRDDSATIIAATSGSIQMDPSRAYFPAGNVRADVRAVNGTTIKGAGVLNNPWGPVT